MESDDFSTAGILPDYSLPWNELLQRLVKFLLGEQTSIQTSDDREMVIINSTVLFLGHITTVDVIQHNKQMVGVILGVRADGQGKGVSKARWTLPISAKAVETGEIICVLGGASKPTIIRTCKDHFAIIMIATSPMEEPSGNRVSRSLEITQPKPEFPSDLLLIWDWENPTPESQALREYEDVVKREGCHPDYSKGSSEAHLDRATRIWKSAMFLEYVEECKKADERVQEATRPSKQSSMKWDQVPTRQSAVNTSIHRFHGLRSLGILRY
ncbi:hypothetical protein BU25DRAFT_421506 [Macroventuria anomochaeta]|uniref:Uncharacterized protein n=1 Tax=Macroventuria anomochaeta TaxID=301207 RepID=A0ACB6S0M5_9PLEO|nr:uncharacterized protein BU25DRAFT_421506 [Macroventuria anomochaeta]KAF2627493.1 hypothetical protein BU25DRAFT_421506 [Macroventuria anomochaeta]